MDTFMGKPIHGGSNLVEVLTKPLCDFCEDPAEVDGKTSLFAGFGGSWANMCYDHFAAYGEGLGTGLGQRLVTKA